MPKHTVGIIFGSRTVEHEVSVVTAQQLIPAFDRDKYELIPFYITKKGRWITGERLLKMEAYKDLDPNDYDRVYLVADPDVGLLVESAGVGRLLGGRKELEVDVLFPAMHGTFGEDGTLQGALEMANIPYVGSGVVGAAVGQDKIVMKSVFKGNDLPIVAYLWFRRTEWEGAPEGVVEAVEAELGYPVFVKPANLGSSVGISKAKDADELRYALDVAAHYDRKLVVEESAEGAIEINCSVIGNDDPLPSMCEQPVAWEEFLSYEDKYMRGDKTKGMAGAGSQVPAPLADELTERIQELAVRAFQALDCRGITRVDFLVYPDEGKVYINEVNTLPGSFSLHLWEPTGIPPSELIDRLIDLAFEAYEEKQKTTYVWDSPLLEQLSKAAGKLS